MARRGSEPFRAFEDMVSRMFDDWMPRFGGESRGWSPALDMVDKKDEIMLRADLPGLEQKDIHVDVENGMLTISGSRQGEQEAKENDYYCCERWSGSFTRTVALPAGIDPDKIRATFKNGVLEVHVPKAAKPAGKSIEIKAA
jgi:HSP20 family protein